MSKLRFIMLPVLLQLILVSQAFAGDFDWLKRLSVQAQADPNGFVTKLSARFQIGDAEVRTVIRNVGNQADAYMVLCLAEMSHHSVSYVTRVYREDRHSGWGAMARRLGIKPGSREFHALKAGADLAGGGRREEWRGHGNGHGHGNGNHGRGHGRGRD